MAVSSCKSTYFFGVVAESELTLYDQRDGEAPHYFHRLNVNAVWGDRGAEDGLAFARPRLSCSQP